MGMTAFDPDSSTNGMLETRWETTKHQANGTGDIAQAVADLLQHKSLTRTFGDQGEWEVRTTLVANRQAWRYQSSVFLHGKERRKGFPPIHVDRTRQIRHTGAVTEELLAAFAREAAEVHCARCESVKEYVAMALFFAQPLPWYNKTKKVVLVLLGVAALAAAFWWWKGSTIVGPEQPDRKPPPQSLRWQTLQVVHHYPAGERFEFPLPTLEPMPEGMPIEVTLEASGDQPNWLQLDRERLHIRGIAPLTAANQTYRFTVRAHTAQGSDSLLLVLLTITGPSDRTTPTRQFPGHWAW